MRYRVVAGGVFMVGIEVGKSDFALYPPMNVSID